MTKRFTIPSNVTRDYSTTGGAHRCALPIAGMAMDAAMRPPGTPQPGGTTTITRKDDATMKLNADVSESISKLMTYLGDLLAPEQMEDVKSILEGGEAEAPAMDSLARAANMERQGRLLRAKIMLGNATGFAERFPNAGRLKQV